MSFFKKLFGGGDGGGADAAPKVEARVTYEGFIIEAAPMPEGGQFRLRAFILESDEPDARKETVIRADLFPSADTASQFAITKAKQVIDEQGKFLFS
ncbi:MAG: transcriptional regulator [Devosiaceae bacterium]|nr:transcriptional regulator [Devosiaceae bacterium MH13]